MPMDAKSLGVLTGEENTETVHESNSDTNCRFYTKTESIRIIIKWQWRWDEWGMCHVWRRDEGQVHFAFQNWLPGKQLTPHIVQIIIDQKATYKTVE